MCFVLFHSTMEERLVRMVESKLINQSINEPANTLVNPHVLGREKVSWHLTELYGIPIGGAFEFCTIEILTSSLTSPGRR